MTSSPATCSPARAGDGATTRRKGRRAAPSAPPRPWLLGAALCALLLSPGPPGQAQGPLPERDQTTVVELRHRPAEEVMTALRPHLADRPVSVSTSDNRFLLHGPTRDLGVLIDLIEAIDAPVEMLWVSLAQDQGWPGRAPGSDSGEGWTETRLGTGGGPRRDAAEDGQWGSRRWQTPGGEVQRVLVRDGDWAALEVRSLPRAGGFAAQVQATPWTEVFVPEPTDPDAGTQAGFRVRPQRTGEQVTLEIEHFGVATDPRTRGPQGQARRSVLSGRLGDWIPLGGADLDDAEGATGLIARTRPGGLPRLLVRVTSASPAGP